MNACEEIRQSIDADVPAKVANADRTRFTLWNIYYRSLGGHDETQVERDSGFVRLEAIDDHSTRVTVDLNCCPHYQGISVPEEIARTQQHLRGTLGRCQSPHLMRWETRKPARVRRSSCSVNHSPGG